MVEPEQKLQSPSTEEAQSQERVYGLATSVWKGDSDNIVEEIEKRASSILTLSLESDLRQVIEARLFRLVIEKQSEELVALLETHENRVCLLGLSMTKKLEDMVSEFERKKKEVGLFYESVVELERDIGLKLRVEVDRRKEESKKLEAKKSEVMLLEVAIDKRYAELKRKEEAFEMRLKQEAEKLRVDMVSEIEGKKEEAGLVVESINEAEKEKTVELKRKEEAASLHQVAESRKRSNLKLEPSLLVNEESDAASLTRLAKRHKTQEQKEMLDEDPKPLTFPEIKFNDFNKSMSAFDVDQVWALYDVIDDMPRIYAQIRRIFGSELSLEVTLLEHVETTKDEKCFVPSSSCGRFEYGVTEIKSHLMFAHEMQYTKCGEDIVVNPKIGETWALFSDWSTSSWNSHSEPPYRYDFVEVISEFDDVVGIAVAYMERVDGFLSVFKHAEQHGLIQRMISPKEMESFSHKVDSLKLSGEEKEGVPAGCFELNPAAAPSHHLVLEENQDGSTPALAINLD